MLRNFIIRMLYGPCGKLRRYTTIAPDGQLIVLCYHRLSEFVNNGCDCINPQKDVGIVQS